jgi:hypothetical protein
MNRTRRHLGTKAMELFGRPDLFGGWRGNPPTFLLHPYLTSKQKVAAFEIVLREYPYEAYGTTMVGNEIKTYSAD